MYTAFALIANKNVHANILTVRDFNTHMHNLHSAVYKEATNARNNTFKMMFFYVGHYECGQSCSSASVADVTSQAFW